MQADGEAKATGTCLRSLDRHASLIAARGIVCRSVRESAQQPLSQALKGSLFAMHRNTRSRAKRPWPVERMASNHVVKSFM
eukprot:5313108-Amphidinium_carterae.2